MKLKHIIIQNARFAEFAGFALKNKLNVKENLLGC
jgi:hypothetical protein